MLKFSQPKKTMFENGKISAGIEQSKDGKQTPSLDFENFYGKSTRDFLRSPNSCFETLNLE